MPDISMCKNDDCSKKLRCYRYTATPCEFWQAYVNFSNEDGACEYFWDNDLKENNKE